MNMRIAFGTDDNISLKQERFGDSIQFRIVTIENNVLTTIELRMNPFSDPLIENKPPKILLLLNDCDIFLGRSWRAGSFTLFTENGKTVFLCSKENLDEITSAILHGEFSSCKKFDNVKQKFIPA